MKLDGLVADPFPTYRKIQLGTAWEIYKGMQEFQSINKSLKSSSKYLVYHKCFYSWGNVKKQATAKVRKEYLLEKTDLISNRSSQQLGKNLLIDGNPNEQMVQTVNENVQMSVAQCVGAVYFITTQARNTKIKEQNQQLQISIQNQI